MRDVAMYISATKIAMKQQRHAEVPHEHQHASDKTHMTSSGPKYFVAGTGTPSTWRVGTESSILLVVEVAGEEDHDGQLGELGRLDREAEGMDPELRAVDRRCPATMVSTSSPRPERAHDVAVAVELHVIAHQQRP